MIATPQEKSVFNQNQIVDINASHAGEHSYADHLISSLGRGVPCMHTKHIHLEPQGDHIYIKYIIIYNLFEKKQPSTQPT